VRLEGDAAAITAGTVGQGGEGCESDLCGVGGSEGLATGKMPARELRRMGVFAQEGDLILRIERLKPN
jgi:hypothetical protein